MAERPSGRGRRKVRVSPAEARARSTVAGVLILQLVANGLGTVVVGLYFGLLFPKVAEDNLNTLDLNLWVFGTYLLAMVAIAVPLNAVMLRRAVVWVRQGRPPTERQRRLLFKLPFLETLSAFASWVGAAVLFTIINQDVRRVSVGIALAGVVTCTLLYLMLVGHFRPVFAVALETSDLPADRRQVMPRLMLAWLLGSAVPLLAIGLSPLIAPAPLTGERLGWIAGVSAVAGGLVMLVAIAGISRPLNRVRIALREIEQGDLDVHLPVDDLGELGRLSEGVNNLVAGIREREELRDLFGRQVGQTDLADMALQGGPSAKSTRREVTVLFVDLRGYTRFAERQEPEEVVAMLNRFFRVVVAVVNREGGWINKFEGDAALCLFGAPQDQPDHAERALRAAESLPRELDVTDGLLAAGIGVATGEVIAGFIGTAERFEYTVIGDVVNLASRLCDQAKSERTGVLATAETVEEAENADAWRPAGRVTVRGRRERVAVYTLDTPGRRSRRRGTSRSSRAEHSAP
ncbi:MAG: adenylate/guanylate cyclase domain-containing protein [Acidimicrobiales bacterium]